MPDTGYYEKIPRPESVEIFIRYLNGIRVINKVKKLSDQIIEIDRPKGSSLVVFMTNIYIVGLADVLDILAHNMQINTIVTMSRWNSYTSEAKQHCKEHEIGLFRFNEFLGAVYYEGKEFLNYIPPDKG